MKMDVTAGVKQSIAVTLVLAGVIGLLLMAWIGGELRYRNCLAEVELRNPVVLAQEPGDAGAERSQREDEISDCSRWF